MRVIHLANFDGKGPALAAFRIHQALRRLGHDSRMLVPEKRTEEASVDLYPISAAFMTRIRRRVRRARITRAFAPYRASRPPGLEDFSDDRSIHGDDLLHHLFAADVVNVHALRAFADYEAFFRIVPRHVPVVRTMHDLNFFTGGCHTAEGCLKYLESCGACPQLGSPWEDDLSRQIWQRKRHALAQVAIDRVHLVAPSQWLATEARRSSLAKHLPITVIPHGLDLDIFQPRDRDAARERLGIPSRARVVLFVAEPISRRLKGFTHLVNALTNVPDRDAVILIAAGSGIPPAQPDIRFIQMGYVQDDRLLSTLYSAADVFVMPSAAESFGLAALQALASGTPVIAFDVGGLREIVRPGITGLLVPSQDAKALGTAITTLLNDAERRRQMSQNCRRIAVSEYSLDLQAKRNVELYQSIIGRGLRPG